MDSLTGACIPYYALLNLQPKSLLEGLLCGNHNQIIQRIVVLGAHPRMRTQKRSLS